MKYFIFVLFVFFKVICFSQIQDSLKVLYVNDKDLFKGEGIIFSKENNIDYKNTKDELRFTPKLQQIYLAEKIIIEQYNDVRKEDIRIVNYKPIKKVKKYFYCYNRQYFGYINNEEEILIICLINFKNKNKTMSNIDNWGEKFIIGTGGFFDKNRILLGVNLTNEELFIP